MNEATTMQCRDLEHLAVLYACDELDATQRAAVEAHVAGCSACAALLARECSFVQVLDKRSLLEPSPLLLAQCRGELSDSLDDLAAVSLWDRVERWVPVRALFTARPAFAGALCIMVGIALGTMAPRWFESRQPAVISPGATVSDSGAQQFDLNNISFFPSDDPSRPNIMLNVTRERPETLRGTMDDPEMRRMLIQVVQNTQRFDSGLRLDSLEALRTRADDAEVREALCFAARNDRNPGVRLKALEALRGFEQEARVRDTFLEALQRDDNPGARMEAINALRALMEKPQASPDAQIYQVFRDRMQNDPNNYIRLQSAAAMRLASARTPQ